MILSLIILTFWFWLSRLVWISNPDPVFWLQVRGWKPKSITAPRMEILGDQQHWVSRMRR
ncbi:hypothetical protein A2V82_15310 [candidate division KSB1 bacterium RBG_16_48_16]|nr:MAG: hypothetical protein A2V82_15310 [candidate division KSB1 bacterium RBG_16_48_16]